MNSKVVGIFISKNHYELIKKNNLLPSYSEFESAAETFQISICFLSIECFYDINKTKGLIRSNRCSIYEEVSIQVPKIIYNRASLNNKKVRQALKQCIDSGSIVFNYIPIKNSKYFVNNVLKKEKQIINHLPLTMKGSKENLEKALLTNSFLFIKPCYSSIGKGIMYLEKQENGNWYLYEKLSKNKSWEKRIYTSLEKARLEQLFKHRSFIIQERIPLATYENRPYDLRVVVQKNGKGEWDITGIVVKVAPNNQLITNVGRGGEIGELQNFFTNNNISVLEVTKKINTLAINVAKALEKTWPYISDLGLDIGICNNGHPYFIECNLRGQYSSLRRDKNFLFLWKKTHQTPIAYANYLLERYK